MALVQIQRVRAKETIANLIRVHKQTVHEIDEGGKKFWKDGDDITVKIRERCLFEIEQCRMVRDAIDNMAMGDIKRAAALCEQLQEFIGSFATPN